MRKIHNTEPGYIAERMNPYFKGKKVVIYLARKQGFDVSGGKYAVVCDLHATCWGETSIPKARWLMKNPDEFCTECAIIRKEKQ